jgi:hypothetical protein
MLESFEHSTNSCLCPGRLKNKIQIADRLSQLCKTKTKYNFLEKNLLRFGDLLDAYKKISFKISLYILGKRNYIIIFFSLCSPLQN